MIRQTISRRFATIFSVLAFAVACSDGTTEPQGPAEVASVTFTPAERSVMAWAQVQMTISVKDAAGHPIQGRPVEWDSEQEEIATISETGVVTGVSAGEATITATVDGKRGTATVTVTWPPVAFVTLDGEAFTLEEPSTRQLIATPRDAQGRAIPGLGMTWQSSDEGVASVNALGAVTAVRPGTARVTVTVHGKTAEALITVTADHPYDLVYHTLEGTTPSLWQLDIRGAQESPTRLVPDRDGANVVPSPDGSRIAFVSGAPDAGIWVANRDGSDAREVVIGSRWSPVYQPAWSPDGTKIAYTRRLETGGEQIWIVDVATRLTLATTDPHGTGHSWPTWSPVPIDGAYRIAYAQKIGSRSEIWSMREDFTDARAVTQGFDRYDTQPAWSPDGQTIAFQRATTSGFDIWLVDAEGGNELGLVGLYLAGEQSTPRWSPDGKLVAFASKHETYGQATSVWQIYTVRATGGGLARRTSGAGDKTLPAWISRAP